MRIVKAKSKEWGCFWLYPSLYYTKTSGGIKRPPADPQYAILLAWGWWILVLWEWNPKNTKKRR